MRRDLPERLRPYREGYVIAAIGLFLTLATVHIWGPTSVFVMFYMGAGVWLVNGTGQATDTRDRAEAATLRRRYAYQTEQGVEAAASETEDEDLQFARRNRRLPYARGRRARARAGSALPLRR
jgi:hypothetical protein